MSNQVKAMRSIFLVIVLSMFSQSRSANVSETWRWTFNGNVFAGVNHQHRKFRDFTEFEAQNWAMGMGERTLGPGRLIVDTMVSLETFTLKEIGSAQVFQTGETFNNAPLIDYQHPHDLFMTLERDIRAPGRRMDAEDIGRGGRAACARPAAVHASAVSGRKSAVTTRAPSPRLDSRHTRCAHRRSVSTGLRN